MYLTKRAYVKNWNHQKPEKKHQITVKLGGKKRSDIDASKISYLILDVMYWSKANQIHDWFVNNCQDGEDSHQTSYVEKEKLLELLNICKKIVDESVMKPDVLTVGTRHSNGVTEPIKENGFVISNPEIAQSLLPTSQGFFFGSTEYDQYYIEDLKETIKVLETENLDSDDNVFEYEYHASW